MEVKDAYPWCGVDAPFLMSLAIFRGVPPQELCRIAPHISPETYGTRKNKKSEDKDSDRLLPRDVIVTASPAAIPEEEQALYIVEDGEVLLSLLGLEPYRQVHPVTMRHLRRGEHFGLSSITAPHKGKCTDVSAVGSCKLLRLSREGFLLLPGAVQARLHQEASQESNPVRMAALEPVRRLLHNVEPIYFWAICELFQEARFGDGECVLQSGYENEQGWCVVAEGSLWALLQADELQELTEEDLVLTKYQQGNSFGLAEIIENNPCPATVVAVGPVVLYHIPPAAWLCVPQCVQQALQPLVEAQDTLLEEAHQRALQVLRKLQKAKDEVLQQVATILNEGGQDEDAVRFVMAHARTCQVRCKLGRHCDSAKRKIVHLKDHAAACTAPDKSLCQKCIMYQDINSGLSEETALMLLKNARPKAFKN